MVALPHRLIAGVLARDAALLHRLIEASGRSTTCIVLTAVQSSKSSKTRSSSEMQRAWARACPWRTESVMAAGHAGQLTPSAVKMISRQGIVLLILEFGNV